MSQLLNSSSSTLPSLPSSLRSQFTSLSGGQQSVVRKIVAYWWDRLWPLKFSMVPESSPMAYLFVLHDVFGAGDLSQSEASILMAIFFHSQGGKHGVVRDQLEKHFPRRLYETNIARLKKRGYITRKHFDPTTGHSSYLKVNRHSQHIFMFLTPKAMDALYNMEKRFKAGCKALYTEDFAEANKKPDS